MSQEAEIGESVRRRRRQQGLTLEELATSSGVSTAMLSEVERGVKNPTVRLAYQIARALGCSLTDLIEESFEPIVRVIKEGERRVLVDPETGVVRHGISSELMHPGIELAWYSIPPKSTAGEMEPNRHGIIEHATVIHGKLTLLLGGNRHDLGPRDTITYGPQTTTEYRNEGDEPCEFFMLADTTRVHP